MVESIARQIEKLKEQIHAKDRQNANNCPTCGQPLWLAYQPVAGGNIVHSCGGAFPRLDDGTLVPQPQKLVIGVSPDDI